MFEEIAEWVKQYSMFFLLMTVISSMAVKKEYQRYIHFFVEVVMVISLAMPLLQWMGRSDDFLGNLEYDSFWQELDTIRMDQEKAEFYGKEQSIEYYKKAIALDVGTMAEAAGYRVSEAEIGMNEAYEITGICLEVAKEEDAVIIGSIEAEPEDAGITALKEQIADYYKLDVADISIRD